MRTGWSLSTPCWGPTLVGATAIYAVRDPDASVVTVTFSLTVVQATAFEGPPELGIGMSLAWQSGIFFGSRVVGAAFVLAVLGWGTGFYGPPIYGVSIGGVVFSPLWAPGIALLGFPIAAAAIGTVMALQCGYSQTGSSSGHFSRWACSRTMTFSAHLACRPPHPLNGLDWCWRFGAIRNS